MKNKYEVRGNEVAIFIQHNGGYVETLINLRDFDRVNAYENAWTVTKQNNNLYVIGYRKQGNISMHRWIMKPPRHKVVDHINHDTLDNRRSNLRIVTTGINVLNQNSKGVYYDKKLNKYVARLSVNRERKVLGYFSSEDEAIEVVKAAREQAIKQQIKEMGRECVFCGSYTTDRFILLDGEVVDIHWSCIDLMKEQYQDKFSKCVRLEMEMVNSF